MVPKAGQWMRLWAVRSCSPWPWSPQKLQMPRLVGVALGELWSDWLGPLAELFLGLKSLNGVWPGGVARGRLGVAFPDPVPERGAGRRC